MESNSPAFQWSPPSEGAEATTDNDQPLTAIAASHTYVLEVVATAQDGCSESEYAWIQVVGTSTARHLRESISAARAAVEANPGDTKRRYWLGRLYYDNNLLSEAEQSCRELLETDAGLDDARLMLADTLFRRNARQEALQELAALFAQSPEHQAGWLLLAPQVASGDWVGDAQWPVSVVGALAAASKHPSSLALQLASICYLGGHVQWYLPEGTCEDLVKRFPDSAAAQAVLGRSRLARSEEGGADAYSAFTKATELEPSNPYYWQSRIWTAGEKEMGECLAQALAAMRRYGIPNEPPYMDPLALCDSVIACATSLRIADPSPAVRAWQKYRAEIEAASRIPLRQGG